MHPLTTTIFTLGFLAACTADDEGTTNNPSPIDDSGNPPGESLVRVVHASPDAPAVDVYAEGVTEPLVTGLAYGDTTGFLPLPEATYTLELRVAGAEPSSDPAYTQMLDVPADETITAVALGLLGSTDDAEAFRILPLVHGFDPVDDGTARVRILHASPTAPTVAVDVGNDGSPEVSGLARFAETGAMGVALPSDAALQIGLWAREPLERVTAFTTPVLPDGAELFVIATGLLEKLPREEVGFALLAVGPEGTIGFIKQNPRVYALHASPDAPAVDVYAGDGELVDDLVFGELAGPLQVPPGAYGLDFFAHEVGSTRPSGDPAAQSITPELPAGETVLAIATGFLGGAPTFQLMPVVEAFDVLDDNARVSVAHASPDAPVVDVGTVAGGTVTAVPDWSGLAFGETSSREGVSLPAGTYDLGVAGSGSTSAVFTFSGLSLDAGDRIVAVAAGALGQDFQLMLVDATTSPWIVANVSPDAQ